MKNFYNQMEHSMGIYMLAKKAEDKLYVIAMKPNVELVDKYY